MPVTLSTPLSLYSIPVVWLTAFLPCTMKAYGSHPADSRIQQLEPRQSTSRFATSDKVSRLRSLHESCAWTAPTITGMRIFPYGLQPWSVFPAWGHIARLDNYTLNVVSLLYIGGRITYNYIYFNQATELQSLVRSAVYFSTLSLPMYLIFKAAAKIAAAEA
ncbi:hypothetical protein B0H13DRAFT_2572415 [Mycena leptocephala]|nr:hypothetical protein B0H13DRAFT_2572415 [Mycena leptocephala]